MGCAELVWKFQLCCLLVEKNPVWLKYFSPTDLWVMHFPVLFFLSAVHEYYDDYCCYYCSYFFLIQIINLLKWHCIKVWQQSMSGSPFMLDHTKMWLLFIGFWTLSAESMPIRLRHTNDDPVFCPLSYNIEVSSIFKISCPFLNNHTLIFSTSHSPLFFFSFAHLSTHSLNSLPS